MNGFKPGLQGNNCLENERRALLAIKSDMYDPKDWLSSWTGYDCCKWRGVACDNVTGHVTRLDLHFPYAYEYDPREDSIGANSVLQRMASPTSSFYIPKDKIQITAKGSTDEYIRILYLVTSIDLSHNNLSGEIPKEMLLLRGLHFLSLSNNHLTGSIPENIGVLTELFSLDLSMNDLTGTIPSNLSALNFLSHLNLSFNNLSGRVPTGNQFSTFNDPAIYAGNKDLCGWPLPECPGDGAQRGPLRARKDDDGNGGKLEKVLDYAFVAMGFIVGFWAYWGTMIMKKSMRIALFQMVDRIYDWIYVQLAVKIGR